MDKKNIYVTSPTLPPLEEFIPYLQQIWDNKVLTNGGPFHQQLEKELCDYLGVEYISLFANGTLALVTALQALRVTGEVITTPYSFVATSHSLLWNGIKPVFIDIDPNTLNLDPAMIEAAITPHTTAIMPVHVYGHPCNVDAVSYTHLDVYKRQEVYYALVDEKYDFFNYFPIKIEFAENVKANAENYAVYAAFIAQKCQQFNCLHFTSEAVAALLQAMHRLIEDQTRLSTKFADLEKLILESSAVAG